MRKVASAQDASRAARNRRLARRSMREAAGAPTLVDPLDSMQAASPQASPGRDTEVVWRRFSMLVMLDKPGHETEPPARGAATAASRAGSDPARPQELPIAPLDTRPFEAARRPARRLIAAAFLVLISGVPFGAQPGPFIAPAPREAPRAMAVENAMAPWPIGLAIVRRADPPTGLPPLDAVFAATAPGAPAASGDPAPARPAGLRVARAAPVSAPLPTKRAATTKDAAQSFFSDPIGFISELSRKERPEGTVWSDRRD